MRYVSKPETVAERIEDIRKRTPPPEGRLARHDYISKDDFADLIGISRSRIYAWTRHENPEFPDEDSRERLAKVSGGRYEPDDFVPDDREGGRLARRIAALERTVDILERHIFGEGGAQARGV